MNPHAATWEEVSTLLREARACLASDGSNASSAPAPPTALTNTLGELEEFLEHDELELAWDTLAQIAEQAHAPAVCWQKLAGAARLMQLPEKAKAAERRVAPPTEGYHEGRAGQE